MRWNFIPPFAQIKPYGGLGVDRKSLVRIDHDTKEARIGVNELALIARLEVPQHGWFVEIGQVGHVLALFKLGWIDLMDLLALQRLFLLNTGL